MELSIIHQFLYFLGIYFFIKIIISFTKIFYKHFILKEVDFKKIYGDGWCIITGGSTGIGFSYAKQFLKRKFKILLISSNIERLEKAKNDLLKLYPDSKIEILDYNLSRAYNQEIVDDLKSKMNEKIKNEDISILINNAGGGNSKYLSRHTVEEINNCINLNIYSVIFMTKICMENMLKKSNYKSLIVQSGSQMASIRLQKYSIYASTKNFIDSFNSVISIENRNQIDCTYIEIGPVDTKLNNSSMPFKISPDKHAEYAMKFMGNYVFSGPVCLYHELEMFLVFLPCIRRKLLKQGETVFGKQKINKKIE